MVTVTIKRYLASLEEAERLKPPKERNFQNLTTIANEANIHYTVISRFANNRMGRIDVQTLDKILTAFHKLGHKTGVGDLLEFHGEKNK